MIMDKYNPRKYLWQDSPLAHIGIIIHKNTSTSKHSSKDKDMHTLSVENANDKDDNYGDDDINEVGSVACSASHVYKYTPCSELGQKKTKY